MAPSANLRSALHNRGVHNPALGQIGEQLVECLLVVIQVAGANLSVEALPRVLLGHYPTKTNNMFASKMCVIWGDSFRVSLQKVMLMGMFLPIPNNTII